MKFLEKLYYLGRPADGFGWGIANANLVKALSKICNVVVDTSSREEFDAPVFVPVADSTLHLMRRVKKAPRLLGYCFTEWPLTTDAKRNSRQFDVLFAGSSWNVAKLKAAKIVRVEKLVQGVDFTRFKPIPPSDRKGFVVFSGGKYEFRKGQDYVLRAMRHFMQQRSDVVLLCAWHNPWPQSAASMKNSWLIDPAKPFDGLPADRIIQIPAVPNEKTPDIYGMAHVGLFPNRCEAGTNMVMTEFMACARPVIATFAHGHRDVLDGAGPLKLTNGSEDAAGWFNPNVSDIISHLEFAYLNREEMIGRGRKCRNLAEQLSWDNCARKICERAFGELPDPDLQ